MQVCWFEFSKNGHEKRKITHCNETKIEDINLLFKYFERESRKNKTSLDSNKIFKKMADAFQISCTTIKRSVLNGKMKGIVSKPSKNKMDDIEK